MKIYNQLKELEKTDHYYRLNDLVVTYKQNIKFKDRAQLYNSKECEKYIRPFYDWCIELKEVFYVIYVNNQNQVIGQYKVSEGNMASCIVDVKTIFAAAIQCLASGIVLIHNHPSGSLKPSDKDISITRQIKEAAKIFDMQLNDHIILTSDGYYSFADEGEI